jgi:hypothetical protein
VQVLRTSKLHAADPAAARLAFINEHIDTAFPDDGAQWSVTVLTYNISKRPADLVFRLSHRYTAVVNFRHCY